MEEEEVETFTGEGHWFAVEIGLWFWAIELTDPVFDVEDLVLVMMGLFTDEEDVEFEVEDADVEVVVLAAVVEEGEITAAAAAKDGSMGWGWYD